MDQYLLEKLTKELKISSLNIIRENVEIAFLDILSQSKLSTKLIFYGGTSLRLAYNSPRFSEDMDFLMIKNINVNDLKKLIEELIKNYSGLYLKDIKMKRNTLFALLNLTYPNLKHPLNIKIEISKKKNGVIFNYIPLSSPCSHLNPIVATADLLSLKNLKIKAIINRDDPKDWFDLWYISKILKEPFIPPKKFSFNHKEFRNQLKRFLPQNRWLLIEQIYV
jgi:predicted nucleotidyltransferase component of viral defense system